MICMTKIGNVAHMLGNRIPAQRMRYFMSRGRSGERYGDEDELLQVR